MTAYCFVWSPGFSNWTCILGALPLGTASDGETYSVAVCCECTITAAAPINNSKQPIRSTLLIKFLTSFSNSLCVKRDDLLFVGPTARQLGNLLVLNVRAQRHLRAGPRTCELNSVCNLLQIGSGQLETGGCNPAIH